MYSMHSFSTCNTITFILDIAAYNFIYISARCGNFQSTYSRLLCCGAGGSISAVILFKLALYALYHHRAAFLGHRWRWQGECNTTPTIRIKYLLAKLMVTVILVLGFGICKI